MRINNEMTLLISKFASRARRIIGNIKIEALYRDYDYQIEIFNKADMSLDLELTNLSSELKEKLGFKYPSVKARLEANQQALQKI